MLEALRQNGAGFEAIKNFKKADWINVLNPTKEEIAELSSNFNLPETMISSLHDIDEIPVMEKENGFIFIILRTPVKELRDLDYTTVPIGIFITESNVITVCFFENPALAAVKLQKFKFDRSTFLLKLLMISSRTYLNYLKEINNKINKIEKELEKSQKNEEIIRLLDIEKSLVYFTTSLKSDQILLEKISKSKEIIKTEYDNEFILDVIDENRQAIEMTNIYSDILSNTMDAFASIISNNLNIVMKMLASVTIILSIPILVASIYGMNVNLPFQNSANAFWIVMLISMILSVIGVLIFWKKRLF